jgi:uncharacterized protein YcgL (UPF0745 family)
LKKNPVTIPVLTPVLTHVISPNPADTFKKLDLALEAELNAKLIANNTVASFVNDLSDSSSQDSFVADSNDLEVSHPSSTPERVKRDMVFLKNSWANMAELEENEALHVADADPSTETLNSADGFHVKLSKAKKKLIREVFSLARIHMQPGQRWFKSLSKEVHLLEFKGPC